MRIDVRRENISWNPAKCKFLYISSQLFLTYDDDDNDNDDDVVIEKESQRSLTFNNK